MSEANPTTLAPVSEAEVAELRMHQTVPWCSVVLNRLLAEREADKTRIREAEALLKPLARVATNAMKFPPSVDRHGVFIWAENGGGNLRISLADADAAAEFLSHSKAT